jgi:hypothetical protein
MINIEFMGCFLEGAVCFWGGLSVEIFRVRGTTKKEIRKPPSHWH